MTMVVTVRADVDLNEIQNRNLLRNQFGRGVFQIRGLPSREILPLHRNFISLTPSSLARGASKEIEPNPFLAPRSSVCFQSYR